MTKSAKEALLLAGLVLVLSTRLVWAQELPAFPSPPAGSSQVGVAAAVRGGVQLTTPDAVGKVVQSGLPIFLGDTITTGPDSYLQILLLDETTFTIGPNSALAIDTFVYDPASQAGRVSARVVKGTFRFITGKIARRHPEEMEVKLPAGVIGIRGTIAAGHVEGLSARVVLLGPGPKNNTGDPPGRITVRTTADSTTHQVDLIRPGFGTFIAGPDAIPTPPAAVPAAELDAMTTALAPATEAEPAQAEPAPPVAATEQAGQATAQALTSLEQVTTLTQVAQELESESNEAAQQTAKDSTAVADGTATLDQLRTIETGQFYFAFSSNSGFVQTTDSSGSPVNVAGLLEGDLNVDFGARTIGGGNSSLKADTSSFGGDIFHDEVIEAQSFATGAGNAVFSDTSADTHLVATYTLKNSGGTVGKQLKVEVTHEASAGTLKGSGSFDNLERSSGTAP